MSEENIGFWRGFIRLVTFWKLRKALGLVRAADRQFTSTTDGYRDAFEIHEQKLIGEYNNLRDATAEVVSVQERDQDELKQLKAKHDDRVVKREGALAKYDETEGKDATAAADHQEAFKRYDTEIQQVEARMAELNTRVAERETSIADLLRRLTALQDEIKKLPEQEAQAIADKISAEALIRANDRLQGLQSRLDRGPIEAVLENNRKLMAKAKVVTRLAGTDVERKDEEYEAAGRASASSDRLQQMLAARRAERSAKTGEAPTTTSTTDTEGQTPGRPNLK